jgi:D-threo-aldose 1-dehydrogenase
VTQVGSEGAASGPLINRFVLGCAVMGGLFRPVDDATATAMLEAAWEAGVRAFDTAPHYGAGLSERRLGAFLRQFPRDSFRLSTKVGRILVPTDDDVEGVEGFFGGDHNRRVRDYSAEGVRRSLEESLGRMGLDRIDTALIHDPEDHMSEAMTRACPSLVELREQGVIRSVGAGMNFSAELTQFVRETDVDTVMLAGRYTLLDRSAEADLLPACLEQDVSIIAVGVFNSGILANPRAGANFNYGAAPDEAVDQAIRLKEMCESFDVPLRAVAMQFPLRHPAVATVAVGARTAEQARDNVALLNTNIPAELWAEVDAFTPIVSSDAFRQATREG